MNLDPESERLAGGRPFRFRRIDFEFQIVLVDHRRRLKCDSLVIKCNLRALDHISTADDELQISDPGFATKCSFNVFNTAEKI